MGVPSSAVANGTLQPCDGDATMEKQVYAPSSPPVPDSPMPLSPAPLPEGGPPDAPLALLCAVCSIMRKVPWEEYQIQMQDRCQLSDLPQMQLQATPAAVLALWWGRSSGACVPWVSVSFLATEATLYAETGDPHAQARLLGHC